MRGTLLCFGLRAGIEVGRRHPNSRLPLVSGDLLGMWQGGCGWIRRLIGVERKPGA